MKPVLIPMCGVKTEGQEVREVGVNPVTDSRLHTHNHYEEGPFVPMLQMGIGWGREGCGPFTAAGPDLRHPDTLAAPRKSCRLWTVIYPLWDSL